MRDVAVGVSISSLFLFPEVEAFVGIGGGSGHAASGDMAAAINGTNGGGGAVDAAPRCDGGKSAGSSHTRVAENCKDST